MKIFKYLNKLQTSILIPFIIGGLSLVLSEVLALIAAKLSGEYGSLLQNLSQIILKLIPFDFCYFYVLTSDNEKRSVKAFWSAVCLLMFITCADSLSQLNVTLFWGFVIAFFCLFCFKKFDMAVSFVITGVSCILFGILIGYVNDYWQNLLMSYSKLISEKGIVSSALFAASNTFLSAFGESSLSEMFFYKSFGGSIIIDNNIVTGVKDLFSAGYSGDYLSVYLSGHYLMMFFVFGIAFELMNILKGMQKTVLIILTVSAVLSGNFTLLLLFILLESPYLFFASVLLSSLSYITAFILKLNIGYLQNGGIIEMLLYGDKWIYLISCGVVFIAIGYFITKFSIEKRGISDCINIYIPTRLNSIVSALGGIENIIRFKNNRIEVRNPQLINTVVLNCTINENIIESDDEKFLDLKDYL